MIYVGTDDGLLQITEDGGKNWRKVEKIGDVPELALRQPHCHFKTMMRIRSMSPSKIIRRRLQTLSFQEHRRGSTWTSIKSNLPANWPVWSIAEDHVNPKLLFAGLNSDCSHS